MDYDRDRVLEDLAALRRDLQALHLGSSSEQARILLRLDELEKDVKYLAEHSEASYVSVTRYAPVERLMFGLVALVMIGFVTAVIALVLR